MDSPIDVIKLGIEYTLLAIFLMFVVRVLCLRDDYAKALNQKDIIEMSAKETLEFSEFNTGKDQTNKEETVPADEVLACIRKYRDGSVTIYIDHMNGASMNGKSQIYDSSVSTSDDPETNKKYKQSQLIKDLRMTDYYHPYLVYDNMDVTNKASYNQTGDTVTGIAFLYYQP